MTIVFFIYMLIMVIVAVKGVIIVKQQENVIVESLGKYIKTLYPGLNWIIPFLEKPRPILKKEKRIAKDGKQYSATVYSPFIDLRETVYDFPKQKLLTKDKIVINANVLLFFQITDARKAVYSVENLPDAIDKLTISSLKNIIGELGLDEALVSAHIIKDKLKEILAKGTEKWGVMINKVEIQDIVTE